MAWPAKKSRYPEAAFKDRSFGLCKWCLTAIRPGKDFRTVVGGEDDDGVVIFAHVFDLLHDEADVIVELRHTSFLFRPPILRVAGGLIFRREVGYNVHARRIEPDEEGLAVFFRFVHEVDGQIANL